MPPSQGRKANRAERHGLRSARAGPTCFGRWRTIRKRIVESLAERCPHCAHELSPADQAGLTRKPALRPAHAAGPGRSHWSCRPRPSPGQAFRPVVTRVHRHRGSCPHPAGAQRRRRGIPVFDGKITGRTRFEAIAVFDKLLFLKDIRNEFPCWLDGKSIRRKWEF